MKTILFVLAVGLALIGCDRPEPDQCMRKDLFFECLKAVPKGPERTKYNDWDEVVSECGSSAYYLSMRSPTQIRPECK